MYLWDTNRLASALANDELSSAEKFKYLLISNVMWAASGYLAWLFVFGSRGWLYWYEMFMVVVLTGYGLIRCRDRYSGAPEDRLLESCVVLGVPLGLKLLLFSWTADYATRWLLHWVLGNLRLAGDEYVEMLTVALNAINTFDSFLIAVLGTALYYWRLSVHLGSVAAGPPAPAQEGLPQAARA